jgi:hypothetical protein
MIKGWSRAPGDVTRARDLDFDHLGAKIAEHGGAEGAGEGMRQVENFDVFEGQLHGGSVSSRGY